MSESKNEFDPFEESLIVHRQLRGKIGIVSKLPINDHHALSLAYTPGVARPCEVIAGDPSLARQLTVKSNSVAVVSDGSAVLGLGNIGPQAAIPVMEGKSILFKEFANIDAWPICLASRTASPSILPCVPGREPTPRPFRKYLRVDLCLEFPPKPAGKTNKTPVSAADSDHRVNDNTRLIRFSEYGIVENETDQSKTDCRQEWVATSSKGN